MSPRLAQPSLDGNDLAGQPRRERKILFASAHSIVDFSNGASVATLDVLQGLATAGFDCQAFCTSRLDFQQEVCLEQIVGDLREPYQIRPSICGGERARLLFTRRHRVPITVVRLESSRHTPAEPRGRSERPGVLREVPGCECARRHDHLRRRSHHARHDPDGQGARDSGRVHDP